VKRLDLTGQRFGRLVCTGMAPARGYQAVCHARCDCGNDVTLLATNLKRNTRSCGCLKLERIAVLNQTHGRSRSDGTYTVWLSMRNRCGNPSFGEYERYGGRGIRVCERWQHSFENFLADMGDRPAGTQIDRINGAGNYEPGNCRWATPAQQARNRTSNVLVTIDGETRCLLDWAREYRLPYATVRARIGKLGWDVRLALTTPVQVQRART
jgi:hypothetical protein